MAKQETSPLAMRGKPRFFYGYVVVAVAFLISTVTMGGMYSFGVFFKPLVAEFGWTRAMTSSAYSLRHLVFGFFGILCGRLTDKFGPRIVLTVCGILLGLGYLLMSQISAIWHLYLFYGVIIAAGMSGSYVPLATTVARWFVKRRAIMTAIMTTGGGVGTMIMPPVAEWLISTFGWRTSFAIVGIISSVFIISTAQFLRRNPSQAGQQPYGSDEVKENSLNLGSDGFSFKRAIQTRQFWMLFGLLFCNFFGLQAIMLHIVPHVTDLGISAIIAASVLTIIGGVSIAGRITTGGAADRIGTKAAFAGGLILMAVALLWLLVAKEMWMLYLFAAVFGFAYGGAMPLGSPMAAELFGLRAHGAIFGIIAFGGSLGGAVGPTLAGYIFDKSGSYQSAFLLLGIITAVGAIIASLLTPVSSKGGTNDQGGSA